MLTATLTDRATESYLCCSYSLSLSVCLSLSLILFVCFFLSLRWSVTDRRRERMRRAQVALCCQPAQCVAAYPLLIPVSQCGQANVDFLWRKVLEKSIRRRNMLREMFSFTFTLIDRSEKWMTTTKTILLLMYHSAPTSWKSIRGRARMEELPWTMLASALVWRENIDTPVRQIIAIDRRSPKSTREVVRARTGVISLAAWGWYRSSAGGWCRSSPFPMDRRWSDARINLNLAPAIDDLQERKWRMDLPLVSTSRCQVIIVPDQFSPPSIPSMKPVESERMPLTIDHWSVEAIDGISPHKGEGVRKILSSIDLDSEEKIVRCSDPWGCLRSDADWILPLEWFNYVTTGHAAPLLNAKC